MAIYDPPDGSTDPRPRCTGNCCRAFTTEKPYAEIQREYELSRTRPEQVTIPDVATVASMLIPLGVFRGQELFTCKHHDTKSGNCTIYETRPQMCRGFPGANPCPYRNCASHGPQSTVKKIWNWLRD